MIVVLVMSGWIWWSHSILSLSMYIYISLLLLLWTGQMGFQRQLTSDEIVEQVTRFATHLRSAPPAPLQNEGGGGGGRGKQPKQHGKQQRLSNIVFMGEGKMIVIVPTRMMHDGCEHVMIMSFRQRQSISLTFFFFFNTIY